MQPFVALASAYRSLYWVSIQTTDPSSSTISSAVIAWMKKSPSPVVGLVRRMTVPMLSRKPALSEAEGNWSVVRRAVGYYRYDTPEQLDLLNRLYAVMHFYVDFFLPVMKLAEKIRVGSKVKRVYDKPQTPYARVLASPDVSQEHKAELRETYNLLDLVDLRRQINELQSQILSTVSTP